MISPISGKAMSIEKEDRQLTFRKEKFNVSYHYYLCKESGEQFTSTELDEINLLQLHHQYRVQHHLPFPEEIKRIREKYVLSATRMSEVLGFGVNSYRNYESGEVPSNSNGKLIQLSKDPEKFRSLVDLSEGLTENAKKKLLKTVDGLIEKQEANYFSNEMEEYLLKGRFPNEYSGYRKPSLNRLKEMIIFFSEQIKPWTTQMNKLLFYADFSLFKKTCFSMSGAKYRAINWGPVPNNFNSIFEFISNEGEIEIIQTSFPNGKFGEQLVPNPKRPFNKELFSDIELDVLNEVALKFKKMKTSKIIDLSHKERGWIENKEDRNLISYKYAFDLIQF